MVIRLLLSGIVALALTLLGTPRHACACAAEEMVFRTDNAGDHSCCNAASSGACSLAAAPCGCDEVAASGSVLPAPGADPARLNAAPLVIVVSPLSAERDPGSAPVGGWGAHGARGPPETGPPLYLVQRALLV